MLLRLLDPEDMGHLVDHGARVEIARCLGLLPLGPELARSVPVPHMLPDEPDDANTGL